MNRTQIELNAVCFHTPASVLNRHNLTVCFYAAAEFSTVLTVQLAPVKK